MAIPKFGLAKPSRVCVECAPVLEVHGARALGMPDGVSGEASAAVATVAAHLDGMVSAIRTATDLSNDPSQRTAAADGPVVHDGASEGAERPCLASPLPLHTTAATAPLPAHTPTNPFRSPTAGTPATASTPEHAGANPFGAAGATSASRTPTPAERGGAEANPFGAAGASPVAPIGTPAPDLAHIPANPFAASPIGLRAAAISAPREVSHGGEAPGGMHGGGNPFAGSPGGRSCGVSAAADLFDAFDGSSPARPPAALNPFDAAAGRRDGAMEQ